MSQAHASFRAGLETQGFTSGLRVIERETKVSTVRMEREFAKVGKSTFGNRAGGISMQASDIAVQLQGGAKAATVLAQQGSQIASMFGPTGAVIGGVIAIGAGIYSWATNARQANDQLAGTLSLMRDIEQRQRSVQSTAQSDARTAERLSFGSDPNGQIMRLKSEFEEDIKRMQAAFNAEPAHLRDDGIHNAALASRRKRFDAERQVIYDAREEQNEQKRLRAEEKKEEGRISDLREHEQRQKQDFLDDQRKQQDEEAEARRGLIDSLREADRVQEENTRRNVRLAELQDQLGRATAKASIQRQADSGQSILDGAAEHLKGPAQRAAEREGRQAAARATEREISRRLDRADQHRRAIGSAGMTPEERANLREDARRNVHAAKNKDKLFAKFEESQIEALSKAMMKAADELIPR